MLISDARHHGDAPVGPLNRNFPAFCVIALGMMLFPGYREERISRGEDISLMKGFALLTTRWRVLLLLAFIAGAANYLLLLSQI